jgi:uncharacterized protein (DUF302 family)
LRIFFAQTHAYIGEKSPSPFLRASGTPAAKNVAGEKAMKNHAIQYGYKKALPIPFAQALVKARAALQQEGFGVLFEIDLKAKLKEKLGVEFSNYIILGACNPLLAYQTLQQELDIGLLLPCNVIVYEENGGQAVVAAIDAQKMMGVVGNPQLETAAAQVNEKLRRVIDQL